MRQIFLSAFLAVTCSGCAAPLMRSTLAGPPTPAQLSELWEEPNDLAKRNLFDGPWGMELAPDPTATYAFVSAKTDGVSPGFAVTDEHGMEWSVKQGLEARVEVVMSRVLSAVGYHQPPVYYLPRWTISGGPSSGVQSEARFRPKHTVLKDAGEWSWQQNPFVGTRPYNGLRVLMMILNQSDLKNSNNTLYEVAEPRAVGSAAHRWYVVRDIGTASARPAVSIRRATIPGCSSAPGSSTTSRMVRLTSTITVATRNWPITSRPRTCDGCAICSRDCAPSNGVTPSEPAGTTR